MSVDMSKLPADAQVYNDQGMEMEWAEAAVKYAEMYERLLLSAHERGQLDRFRLTPMDDKIYSSFRRVFPDMRVDKLNVAQMKTKANKIAWFNLLEGWKHQLKDYNTGTLCRVDGHAPFGQENSIVMPRSQFYCIEIARCREGVNTKFIEQHGEVLRACYVRSPAGPSTGQSAAGQPQAAPAGPAKPAESE